MSVATFLHDLAERDVRITRNGDRLQLSAAEGILTAELRAEIGARKGEILAFLRDAEVSAEVHAGGAFVLQRAPVGQDFPLSFAQQRLWFLHQLDPDDPVYNLGVSVPLAEPVDDAALVQSLEALTRRHDILRTMFLERDGIPSQVVTDRVPTLRRVDLSDVPPDARTAAILRLRDDEVKRPFDLAATPPVRAVLLHAGGEHALLVVVVHHILVDGWSLGVLVRELGELYDAYRAGQAPASAPLSWQYADYAWSEQRWFEGTDQQPHVDYWKRTLHAPLPSLDLPTDQPRGAVLRSRGAVQPFTIPASLAAQLRRLSRQVGVTLSTTLVALFDTLLYRYSGQTDLLLGLPVANRKQVELESLIGLFINTLVLRSDLSGDPSFRDLLRRVHDAVLDAHEHRDYPFEKLVDLVRPGRTLAQSPLFQAAFILHNAPGYNPYAHDTVGGGAVFELSLHVWDGRDEIPGSFEYNTDLFDAETIAGMVGHLQTLAEGAVTDPAMPISRLPLLPAEERTQLLETWNTTAAAYPRGATVYALIAAQAARTPEAEAVRCGATGVTYGALLAQAGAVAARLREVGVGPETRVGLCMERSVGLVAALLGIWAAGGAYVPLDPGYPRERLAFMVADAGLTAVVTEEQWQEVLPGVTCPVVCLDAAAAGMAVMAGMPPVAPGVKSALESALESGVESGSAAAAPGMGPVAARAVAAAAPGAAGAGGATPLAYVIYTSGSTGVPKGVLVEHGGVVNVLTALAQMVGVTAADTLLAVTTLSFDIAGVELYLPLVVGGRVVLATRAEANDGAALARAVAGSGATVLQATPATWRLLLDAGWQGGPGFRVLCGGEALPRELAAALGETGAAVWNLYGPTETTIWSTAERVVPGAAVGIGRPLANTQVYVLDPHQQLVPVGVPGELYIGGAGVARGYHHRPELTADRFIPAPFAAPSAEQSAALHATPEAGGRLYRTGDQVRYRRDGRLEYLGRLDTQVKVRGFRIELGEIEAALAAHPLVGAATVVTHEVVPGDVRLAAYVTAPPDAAVPDAAALRAWLTDRLPQYMIPSTYTVVDAFPMTPNGKVDRRALAGVTRTEIHTSSSVPPAPGLESVVAQVWRDTLHVEHVWADDNFFDLGGHSLLGVRLLANLEKAVGHRLPVSVLFQGQTVRAMAAALRQDFSGVSFIAVPLRPVGSRPPLFIVPGIDGDVVGYDRVANELPIDQPVYGLRSVGLDAEAAPLERIEEIAHRFLEEIRRIQPHGPYYLSGLCIGGIVAYEIAQQLTARGERVDLLVMIGTWPPSTIPDTVSTARWIQRLSFLREGVGRHVRAMRQRPRGQRLRYLVEKMRILTEMVEQRDVYRGDTQTLQRDLVVRANQRAAARYTPTPYTGDVMLIIPNGTPITQCDDPRLFWKTVVRGECATVLVPGEDSGALLRPAHMRGLTETLAMALDERMPVETAAPCVPAT